MGLRQIMWFLPIDKADIWASVCTGTWREFFMGRRAVAV